MLAVGAANILFPVPAQHTAIHAGVYLAVFAQLHINRVAGKLELIQRIAEQLALLRDAVLPPLALQVVLPLTLQIGVKRTGSEKDYAESRKVKGESFLHHQIELSF